MKNYINRRGTEAETKKAEIMAMVNRICADNSTDCRGLSLSGMASDLLNAVGIDPYLDIFEIPVHSDSQVCICFWFNGEPFELWAGLSYETKEFFTECRRWSEDANGEIVDFSIFAETKEEPTEPEAVEEVADPSEIIAEASEAIKNNKSANRSAWGRGVTVYALELLEELAEGIQGGWLSLDDLDSVQGRKRAMLNGASDWADYSWGGCSLIYNGDIAERLCTPSELKRTRGGEWRPNASEEWLDTQARALHQASRRVSHAIGEALKSRA